MTDLGYPVSDHCDGLRFHNPALEDAAAARPAGPKPGNRLLSILRWRLGGTRSVWPDRIADPAPAGDPRVPPPDGSLALTFIGHASFLLRLGGLAILTDPIFSDRCSPVGWAGPKRARPPGRTLDQLPPIDLVLVSHNHYDHLDLPSLRAIAARDRPRFVTPLGNRLVLARALAEAGIAATAVTELDWWQSTTIGDARVVATPARHFSARTLWDGQRALWSGFMIDGPAGRVLFAGDSGDGPHWRAIAAGLGAPDLALLPIGAYDPRRLMAAVHMDPDEAVGAHLALGARRSVGMHFGTFQLTDEPIDEPPARLAAALDHHDLDRDAFVTLGFGETRLFPAGPGSRDPRLARNGTTHRAAGSLGDDSSSD